MKKSRWLSSVVLLSSSLVCALSLRLYCDSDRSGKYDCNTWFLFANMLPNNVSSASSNSSVIAGVSLLQYPSRWHRRRNALSRARSAAEQNPDHAGEHASGLTSAHLHQVTNENYNQSGIFFRFMLLKFKTAYACFIQLKTLAFMGHSSVVALQ